MTSVLTMLREQLADAESDAERLRAAILLLEQNDATQPPRRGPRRRAEPAPAQLHRTTPRLDRATATTKTQTADPKPAASSSTTQPERRRRSGSARRKAAAKGVSLDSLLEVIGKNPGLTTPALAAITGADQTALLGLLKQSEQKGDVRREGQRRSTSWYRITDEDRIAARAAELTAQASQNN